ncbi:hypothetical protein CN283_11360 [Bacillus thuringiensis]|nr:hypothetical protein CN283_11360 [Bacillus thuringiensis]
MQYKDFATKEEELKVMRFYQNDLNSAKLLINVTHDKVVTDFSTATKVQIAFLKPDGKRVFQDVQNVNQMQGKYYVVLSTQTLIAYGNVIAQLRLTFPNNKVIETCKFVFAVDESIMSDTALESTNEFPVIQKAIEVGEKFKDVDFAPIIAAGELAKGALPKTGGVMTGNIVMDRKVANSTIYSQFITSGVGSGGTSHYFVGMNAAGKYHLYDDVAKITPFEYDPVAKSFNVLSATNLVKKAGDMMTGTLSFDTPNAVGLTFKNGAKNGISMNHKWNAGGTTAEWHLYNWETSQVEVSLTTANGFVVNGKTNLVTKTKDGRATLTLTADATNASPGYQPTATRRGNTVTVAMEITRNVGAAGTNVCTLPVDMCPPATISYSFLANDGSAVAVNVNRTGNIDVFTTGKQMKIVATYVVD